MTPTRHHQGNRAASDGNKITNDQTTINNLLTIYDDDFIESESIKMLQGEIVALEHRQQFLEQEIFEALRHSHSADAFINDLKSRVLFVREEIERLRLEALSLSH
jgi:hypothetical protein